jgi:putative methionine-R-sulfoxide reductase with GAF domain
LTKEFCKISNNSFCAVNGTRGIIQDTDAFQGPYYVCDVNVKSEYCSALFSDGSVNFEEPNPENVTGLLDAEAWRTQAFSPIVVADLEELGSLAGRLFKDFIID